ncbi:MAG: twin-arginine translocation signal domain-containing protein, partial [Gemmatimonadales bacterium]|nr:twin-arginine translocation signal domain-containing protein [Gemmatimonadales bacterium]
MTPDDINRRTFLQGAAAGAAALTVGDQVAAAMTAQDQAAVFAQIPRQHGQTLKMLQDWIALPSIAAENKGYPEGAEYMARLAR